MVASIEVIFSLNLLLCIALGFLLGRERELRHKDAGISTNTFVIMGSMLFTLLSARVDPSSTSRIASGIITGIGFLGAGIIMQKDGSVRNLTTAASVWFAAGIGMSIGYGYYFMAIIATIGGLIVPHLPHFRKYYAEETKKKKKKVSKKKKTR